MAFQFAVKHSNGSFSMRQLGSPNVETKYFPPAGVKVIPEQQFGQLQKAPEKLVAEVLGKPGVFAPWSLGGNPVAATTKRIATAARAIYAWEAAGRPDFVTTSAVPGQNTVPALAEVNDSLGMLARHLEKPFTMRALAAATDTERTGLKDDLTRLQKTIVNLSGVAFIGGELSDAVNALGVINRTKFAFGGQGGTVGNVTVDAGHSVTLTSRRTGESASLNINRLGLTYTP
ncbi:MAG: hypothetical protein K1X64_20390 [Myxococcaceae bacterium]|nr:hypothetical protein [Myxococcaceae bacterium]